MHQAKNNMVTTSTNIQVDKMHEATLSNADGFTAFYGVEHTQSFEDVVDDLAQYCHKNGGALI